MEGIFIALLLGFTTPEKDYQRDLIVNNLGIMATIVQCDAALIAPDTAQKFAGDKELVKMRRTHEGVCLQGSAKPKAAMYVEAVASVPGIHLEAYKSVTLPHFASVQQCKDEMPKISALVPSYMDGYVDLWASCYEIN